MEKQGHLLKKSSRLQRWKKRYFVLKGFQLFYAKTQQSVIIDHINISGCTVAEFSVKNLNHIFQVITPFRNLVLCAENRREMEEWIDALKTAATKEFVEVHVDESEMLSGYHSWYAATHARPTYCNVCSETLSGVTSHGLSCEVCKFKAHKRCAVKASNNCKWTTLASVGRYIIEEEDGEISMPHQWMEGNLPVSAKCSVCDKTCGSVLRMQDWRCLWCKTMVHTNCKEQSGRKCPLGQCRISVLPPTAISTLDSDGLWRATKPPGTSPLLVFVNSKSGDNQGIKMLRRFKQLLNPAQVFDLINGGPKKGLRLFQSFESFRVLVCAGDGSIGWVLSEIDKLGLHKQCQIGVLPLGTGNDLSRVLGWGSSFDDETQLPSLLERMEHAQIKMLDRWAILCYEGTMPPVRTPTPPYVAIARYEDSVADHLAKILHSDSHNTVISSAKVLCETVKDFITKVGLEANDEKEGEEAMSQKCEVLNQKLDALLTTLETESQASELSQEEKDIPSGSCSPSPPFQGAILPPDVSVHPHTKLDTQVLAAKLASVGDNSQEGVCSVSVTKEKEQGQGQAVTTSKPGPTTDTGSEDSNGSNGGRFTPTNRNGRPRRRPTSSTVFRPRDQLMSRANSLKKAIRQIIEHTEKAVDFQNGLTAEMEKENLERYGTENPTTSDVGIDRPVVSGDPHDLDPDCDNSSFYSPETSSESKHKNLTLLTLPPGDLIVHHQDDINITCGNNDSDTNNAFSKIDVPQIVIPEVQVDSGTPPSRDSPTRHNINTSDEPHFNVPSLVVESRTDITDNDINVSTDLQLMSNLSVSGESRLLQERRPKTTLTIPTGYDEKYESEGNEKPPLSPIPGSPSVYPSTPLMLSAASSEENLSTIDLSMPVCASGGTLPGTMHTLTVPTWNYSTDGDTSSACTTPRSLSPAPDSDERTFFDAVLPKTPTKSCDSSRSHKLDFPKSNHPFSRRISTVSMFQKPNCSKREKSPPNDNKRIHFPILGVPVIPQLPGLSGLAGVAGGSFISQVLLANADVLCASASPLMEEDVDLGQYSEKCVMNNYFGIGVDAKISLDFHLKREEHPEKCRSRTKNMMWYGVLGSKEILQKTFKNFDQRVQLECDGKRIPLPNLQGLVVLNIPSYMGGINFWGTHSKNGEHFLPMSYDDNILEVVAVFTSAQLGISRVINLHHHRIAQCRSVKITILGDEGVPVQVDGEAWMQPPGYLRIEHKNRAQMLTRDKVFEEALKAWTEKQKLLKPVSPKPHILSEAETDILHSFVDATETLIKSVKMASIYHTTAEQELMHLATQASEFLDRLYPAGRLAEAERSIPENQQPAIRTQVSDLVSSVRTLYNEANLFLQDKVQTCKLGHEIEEQLNCSLNAMEIEMNKVYEIGGLPHFHAISTEGSARKRRKEKGKFHLMSRLMKSKKHKEPRCGPSDKHVYEWGPGDVGQWLDSLGLSEYKNAFITNDIRGQELLSLGRTDLKELGVSKVGHVKRIQQGIKEMKTKMVFPEKSSTSM